MSFLDLDEFLFDVVQLVDVVYSPIADIKEFPENVDIALVEGAVANDENLELARTIRARSKLVVSLGDCAVTGNVTAMRNPLGDPHRIVERVYVERPDRDGVFPDEVVPALLPKVLPLHQVVDVDVYIPGCPPPADRIKEAIVNLLSGTSQKLSGESIRFG
jgi:NAD-reducing hydrogenase small subunit